MSIDQPAARSWPRRLLTAGGLLVLGLPVMLWLFGSGLAESYSLGTVDPGPYDAVSAADQALYDAALKADLHADSLLWKRDLNGRHPRGHVDIPRLQEADVALQVFGLVTQVPARRSYDATAEGDAIGVVAFVNQWAIGTWRSVPERALHQARLLDETADRSDGALVVIRTRGDLESVLRERDQGARTVAGLLGLEGLQVIENELEGIDRMFDAGIRMAGLTHFFDNEVAGSSSGLEKGGLTELGRQVISRMEELGMAIDLAHASPAAIQDVLAMVTKPVVVSHTGVKATCPGNRNLSDDEIRAIADVGGVIGIGFWSGAVCGTSPGHIAAATAHVVDLVGPEHVALGSDYDGSITAGFDVTGLPMLVPALREAGLADDEIQMVLGENTIRLLLELLPT